MTLLLGLVLAGLSALVTQVGFLLRHRGAVAAPEVELGHPLRSAIALFRSKWWMIGYVLAVVAYVLQVGALTLAALSLVQAVLAGGLVVLAVMAERFFGFELERRQWLGLLLTSLGLAMLAVTGEARSGQESANYSLVAMLVFQAALASIGVALAGGPGWAEKVAGAATSGAAAARARTAAVKGGAIGVCRDMHGQLR